ncbi:prolyl oligopeptidase family serine peptidase [Flavobacterium rakeshii]|uniref:Prolyl oligopeptidase family serine peptidase n=1 Tax=Flavobacterium rakeshii TaxID=1038845 RepID=A0A6N8HG04_9FLAO|nr:prolyl oligopeptidase family serine peptidase [Flavobacterium rakeshii]MUV04610.1 prolyl oligopeptidase family serine peptidase [Flavobacterium rakeshii]
MKYCNIIRNILRKGLLKSVLLLVTCSLSGQVLPQRKILTREAYARWSKPSLTALSSDGKWMAYTLFYETGEDTLFVQSVRDGKKFSLPGAVTGEFSDNSTFTALNRNRILTKINLKSEAKYTYENIIQHGFTAEGNLIIIQSISPGEKELLVIDSNNTVRYQKKVTGMLTAPSGEYIAVTAKEQHKNTLAIIRLDNYSIVLNEENVSDELLPMSWDDQSETFVYMKKDEGSSNHTLCCYSIKSDKRHTLKPESYFGFPQGYQLAYGPVSITDDKAIAFKVQRPELKEKKASQPSVQVWKTSDKWVYPKENSDTYRKSPERVCIWYPNSDKVLQLTDSILPEYFCSGDGHFAILFNAKTYEPQTRLQPPADYFIMNLASGKKELLLKKHSGSSLKLMAMPKTSYFLYFSDGDWWSYDPVNSKHYNITKGRLQTAANNDMQEEAFPYDSPYKVINDDKIVLTTSDGIWLADLHGKSLERLTPPSNNVHYTIIKSATVTGKKGNADGITTGEISNDLSFYVAISTSTGNESGFGEIHKGKYRKLTSGSFHYHDFLVSQNGKTIAFQREDYNYPPEIMLKRQEKKPVPLIQTNRQHHEYLWGHSERIEYTVGNQRLSGALYYPAGYNPDRKYPMVVHIYEKQSHRFRQYVNPSLLDACGFNITMLTTSGYLVLLPDISYTLGTPGPSALECVMAAIDKAITTAKVDTSSIGLIGHSFGGYETNYIITHSNRFAAAVSGSAINDFIRGYLTIGNYKVPDYWRYEHHQMRMDQGLFQNITGYIANSPVFSAQALTTPLLSWSGDNDYQVHWQQSVEFYLALRRLGKPHTLLLYPGEGHALFKHENRKDLTLRILEWFDRYLKNSATPR